VTRLAALVLFPRPGMAGPTPEDLSAAGIDPGRTILCEARTPPVHATEIRRLVAEGKPLDGLVAPAVAAYIAERGLYGDNASH
jgi:nicotinate-nucleotide adenylyltransferase